MGEEGGLEEGGEEKREGIRVGCNAHTDRGDKHTPLDAARQFPPVPVLKYLSQLSISKWLAISDQKRWRSRNK